MSSMSGGSKGKVDQGRRLGERASVVSDLREVHEQRETAETEIKHEHDERFRSRFGQI